MLKRSPLPPRRSRPRRFSPLTAERRRRDAQWKAAVLARDGGRCRRCGTGEVVDAHHVRGRGAYPLLRHVLENGVSLCRWHHRAAHDHPADFMEWWEKERDGV